MPDSPPEPSLFERNVAPLNLPDQVVVALADRNRRRKKADEREPAPAPIVVVDPAPAPKVASAAVLAELPPKVATASPAPSFAELPLDDALDELDAVYAYIARVQPQLNAARADVADLEAVIHARLTERGARIYDGKRLHCRYEKTTVGSASVPFPAALRAELVALNAAAIAADLPPIIPTKELDDALPLVVPDPIVKPDLRKTRKLADRGDVVRVVVARHITEKRTVDRLVVEPIQLVAPPAKKALP